MKSILKEIFSQECLKSKPPVLLDIGASGAIHSYWKDIAKYSVCLAFDADDRELHIEEKENSSFKKLIVFNSLVHPEVAGELDFYLTKSPYCSSALEPDTESLSKWAFGDKFIVERKVKLNSVLLPDALKKSGYDYVDWFKTDSQGLDLNLFLSLPQEIRNKSLVAEFEPGLIDAYKGESKLFSVLAEMSKSVFWLAEFNIKGSQRISVETLNELSDNEFTRKLISFSHKTSPGWGEMLFINGCENLTQERELLLAWAFATITKQHGFALEIAEKGRQSTECEMFYKLHDFSKAQIRKVSILKLIPVIKTKLTKMLGLQ